MSEPASTDDLSFNRFPTAISPSASTFTATLQAVRQHSTALLQGLATLSRIDRGDGARWRELLQKAQQIFTSGDGTEQLENHPELGVLLRQRREQAGLTQAQLGKLIEVHPVTLSNYERGNKEIPLVVQLAVDKVLTEHAA